MDSTPSEAAPADGSRRTNRLVVGVMTGTSLDGIDAALVAISGTGLAMSARAVRHWSAPLGSLAADLRRLAAGEAMPVGGVGRLAVDFGRHLARVLAEGLGDDRPDFVAIHGQTVHHAPPVSVQLVEPAPIVQELQCPVVAQLRQADLAAGGEGAPITPLADWVLLRHADRRRAVVNLGGFCNITWLPAGNDAANIDAISGADVCACNQTLDAAARRGLGTPIDIDGRRARSGIVVKDAVRELEAVLQAQRAGKRSLGSGDEPTAWVDKFTPLLRGEDLVRSAVEGTANVIATTLNETVVEEVIVAGGGARHPVLLECIEASSRAATTTSDAHGVAIEAREAIAMAVLGALCADGVPITLPAVTGARAGVAGAWHGLPGI